MLNVTFKRDDDTRYLRLTLRGHAGQSDIGHDIVCASASILAYTVAQIVKVMEHHGDLDSPPVVEMANGDATIACRCKDDDIFAEAAHTFFVAKVGYTLLAHNYPQYVDVKSVGEA
jgi:uncharacterized protein YsxB (DUF464 family)